MTADASATLFAEPVSACPKTLTDTERALLLERHQRAVAYMKRVNTSPCERWQALWLVISAR